MAVNNLTEEQKDFIHSNKVVMKQKDIAAYLKITPACVNQNIKGRKGKIIVMPQYFDIDKEYKNNYGI